MQYILFVIIFIAIALIVSFVFLKILHIKVFGGIIVMIIVSASGALLGSYYLPLINNISFIKLDMPSAFLGAIILVILLYLSTPKSMK